jgi:predicted transcriptional regulator
VSRRPRLTSDLLVRKGQAIPTGGFAHAGIELSQPLPAPAARGAARVNGVPAPAPLAVDAAPARSPGRRTATAAREARVALTLRLDRERHRRLKVFSARRQQSTQEVLLEALDAYLEACGADCACLQAGPEDCARN